MLEFSDTLLKEPDEPDEPEGEGTNRRIRGPECRRKPVLGMERQTCMRSLMSSLRTDSVLGMSASVLAQSRPMWYNLDRDTVHQPSCRCYRQRTRTGFIVMGVKAMTLEITAPLVADHEPLELPVL